MNGVITCAVCRAHLPEYAAGALAPDPRAQIADHLATCAACQAEANQWAAITEAVRQPTAGDMSSPAALNQILTNVRARLPLAETSAPVASPRITTMPTTRSAPQVADDVADAPHPRKPIFSIISSVAAVLLIAVLATLIFTRQQGGVATHRISAADLRGYQLRSVSFASPNDGWAAGSTIPDPHYDPAQTQPPYVTPVLLHYQNGVWSRETHIADLTANVVVSDIQMVSPQEGWAVAHSELPPNTDGYLEGDILHYQHGVWFKEFVDANHPLYKLAMVSASDGWAVGDRAVLHYDGRAWQPVNNPAFADIVFSAVAAGSSSNVWLAGMYAGGNPGNDAAAPEKVLHYDGRAWKALPDPFVAVRLNALAVASSDATAAVGWSPASSVTNPPHSADFGVSYLFEASERNVLGSETAVHGLQHSLGYTGVAFDAPDDGYIVGGDGIILHLHFTALVDSQPEVHSPTHADLYAVTMLSANDGWIVGTGVILRLVHGAWQNVIP